MVLCELL